MFRFLIRLWKWIKSCFRRNQSPAVTSPKPELSDLEYENLLLELLEEVVQGSNWGEIQGFLIANNLEPEKLASWLRRFGQRWLLQPESHQELGHRLLLLSKIARGELREVTRELGQSIYIVKNEEEELENAETTNNSSSLTPSQSDAQLPQTSVETLEEQDSADFFYETWLLCGLRLEELGRNEEAVASYDQVLKIKPDNYSVWAVRGLLLNKLRRNEEAVASCDQALKLKPDNYAVWLVRGTALSALGRNEEAVASCDQALKLKPDDEEAWNNRGNKLSDLGKNEEALASYDQALKLKPNIEEAWNNRGNKLYYLGKNEEAIASYDQALKIKPDYEEAWYGRGIAAYGSLNRNPYIQQEFVGLFCSEVSQDSQRTILSLEEVDSSQTIAHLKTSLDNSQDVLIKTFDDDDSIKLTEQINQDPSEEIYQLIQQPIPQKLIDLIQQPVAAKVVAQLEQDLFSHPHRSNPQLNLRGYQGQIASLEAELDRAIKKDTHPLGWGILHHVIGKAHYFEGCLYSHPFDYWHKAVASYDRALETLTEADYPESHLEVLQNLIKVQLGLGKTEQADQLRLKGLEILKNLLNRTPSFTAKKQLQLKFVAFQQLNVDILINQGQLIEALTSAELSKNICLNNLLHNWQEQTVCPSYEQIQELLTPEIAIVYWHLSPQSLNTFILKANISEPIIISKSLEQLDKAQLPHSLPRLQDYKNWLKEWNQQYQDYRGKDKKVAEKDRRNHIWRKEMTSRLNQLKTILDINTIQSHLSDITQLILIPHQDLHRLPLHLLFDSFLANPESTINYFPSLQIALTLQQKQSNNSQLSLLNVENPANDLPYAEIESVLINSMFTQSTYIDTATNSQLKTELQQPHNIFHFTGHGAYNQNQPQNSSLTLTGKEQITAQEISQLNLKSYQLISLAACETAITGKETIDTEYVGLVSGFLEAGATSVLSTLWTVEEISSAWLIIRFYQLYLEPKPPALALKQAQQWLQTLTYPELKIWLEELMIGIRETHPNVYAYLLDVIRDIEQKSDKMDVNKTPYTKSDLHSHLSKLGIS